METEFENAVVDCPAEGHYVIKGFPAGSVFIEDEGTLAVPSSVHISPGVPSEALQAIIDDRKGGAKAAEPEPEPEKPKRGRPRKTKTATPAKKGE